MCERVRDENTMELELQSLKLKKYLKNFILFFIFLIKIKIEKSGFFLIIFLIKLKLKLRKLMWR